MNEIGYCKECRNEFNKKHKRHLFCSDYCKHKFQNRNIEKVIVTCSNCGEKLERNKYLIGKQDNFFCDKNCESRFREKEANDIRFCETCGKEFKCKKGDKLRFCSVGCQGIWQSKYRSGKNHPSYNHSVPDEMRVKNCEHCGKEIICEPAEFDKTKFCSKSCMLKGMKFSMTSPHILICDILNSLLIEYETEYRLGRYSFDCFVKTNELAIEIMGTYFHCDVRFYNKSINELQENSLRRDYNKKKLAEENNIQILYLWEHDINNNIKLCEKLILKFVKKNGFLDNYHSMNYSLNRGILCLNKKILIPYFEK